jgi:hypothetical protein
MKFCYENITCCGLFSLQLNSHFYWFHMVFHPLVAPFRSEVIKAAATGMYVFMLYFVIFGPLVARQILL